MQLTRLRVQNLRNITELELELAPGFNLFVGPNGSGKTSVLEAAFLLSHGSSFRTHQPENLIRRQTDTLSVYGEVETRSTRHRLGLQRQGARWLAKLDGEPPNSLAQLFAACAVVCFEPGSHALISGPAEQRRGFMDWAVFHVEPEFAGVARRYRRALRQRNALLKQQASEAELHVWDEELTLAAEPFAAARDAYLRGFVPELISLLASYLPELGAGNVLFRPGWERASSLRDVLLASRGKDRAFGHTTRGPHRADWSLAFDQAPRREQLSRGQEKLCAMACVLAQARLYQQRTGEWPVIALDDLCSELDTAHQQTVMQMLPTDEAQILLTGTEIPEALTHRLASSRLFHVEQGRVQALL